jgi:UDP-glucose 4-epimerase
MTVLVTGGAGYIGSHMAISLLEANEKVVIVDDLSSGNSISVPKEAIFHLGDIGDFETMFSLLQTYNITDIIHFAARIVVPESVSDPLSYYNNNTSKVRNLIAAAIKYNVQSFIFSSTAAVYGEPETVPISETETLNPISPYGRSKLVVEWMLEDSYRAYQMPYAVLRYFNVAGADPYGRTGQSSKISTHLIKIAVQAAIGVRSHVKLFGNDYPTPDGTCIRDYVHVTDLALAHLSALKYLRETKKSIIFNCGYGTGYSVNEVLSAVRDVSGYNFPIEIAARRPGDPAKLVASNKLITSTLGWRAQFNDLYTIIEHALAWEEKIKIKTGTVRIAS